MGVVNTTYTFSGTDTITSSKMNNIIDDTTFTSGAVFGTTLEVASGQLKVRSQGITSNELAAGSVTSNSIADGTIVNADISSAAAIEPSKLGTGAITATATVTTANIIDASVTAPKLNGAQSGTAPVYGCRAWVNFDGTTSADVGGTYARTSVSTAVTINATAHGLIVGNRLFLDFTVSSGTAPFDGMYTVATVVTPDEFTVTSNTTTPSTGTVLLKRRLIRASGNVSSVSVSNGVSATIPTSNSSPSNGQFVVNFAIPMPDANYARSGFANYNGAGSQGFVGGGTLTQSTPEACDIVSGITSTGGSSNYSVTTVMFVG